MSRAFRLSVVLSCLTLAACLFETDRGLAPGELRVRVVVVDGEREVPAAGALARLVGTRFEGRADASGAVVLRNLPAETFDLRLEWTPASGEASGLLLRSVPFGAAGGRDGRDLGVVRLLAFGVIEGVVTDGGTPVVGATVGAAGLGLATTDATGAFTLRHVPAGDWTVGVGRTVDGVPERRGDFEVEVSAGARVTTAFDVGTREATTGGFVQGRVFPADSSADRVGARVTLYDPSVPRLLELGVTDTDGAYRSSRAVPGGVYVLEAIAPDGGRARFEGLAVAGETLAPDLHLPGETDDRDGDWLADADDRCPDVWDPTNADADGKAPGDACDSTLLPAPIVRSLRLLAGGAQAGTVGETLALPIAVELRDAWAEPVAAAPVAFIIVDRGSGDGEGEGEDGNGGEVIAGERRDEVLSVNSGTDGRAAVSWQPGYVADEVQLRVAAADAASLVVSATAVAGPPARLRVESVPGPVPAATPIELAVQAFDDYDNPSPATGALVVTADSPWSSVESLGLVEGLGRIRVGGFTGGTLLFSVSFDDGRATGGVWIEFISRHFGDGAVQGDLDEACDAGAANAVACAYGEASCARCLPDGRPGAGRPSTCGDGVLDDAAGEECDDGAANGPTARCRACRIFDCDGTAFGPLTAPDRLVTSLSDSGPGTLRAALAQGSGFIQIAVEGAIVVSTPLVVPAGAQIVVVGPGRDLLQIERDPALTFVRLVHVPATARLELSDVTLKGGQIFNEYGGCVRNDGVLVLHHARVQDCLATDDPAVAGSGGGGLANFGTAVVASTVVTGNRSEYRGEVGGGGALNWSGATLSVCRSHFVANVAHVYGAGISTLGVVRISDSTFERQWLNAAGAVLRIHPGGSAELTRTTVAGNLGFAAFWNQTGRADALVLRHVTVVNDPPDTFVGPFTASASIFGGASPRPFDSPVVSLGGNVVRAAANTGWDATDVVGTLASPLDLKLSPLGRYGGPLPTVLVGDGSPAQGRVATPPPFDQRGFSTPPGAVEAGATYRRPPVVTAAATATTRGAFSLELASAADTFGRPATLFVDAGPTATDLRTQSLAVPVATGPQAITALVNSVPVPTATSLRMRWVTADGEAVSGLPAVLP